MENYPSIHILLNVGSSYIPKAEYVFRTFCYYLKLSPIFSYGTAYEKVHIYYGTPTKEFYPIRIHYDGKPGPFFSCQELYPVDDVNFVKYKGEFIPFLFSQQGSIFEFDDKHGLIRKDIIASAFYFLTCWREFVMSKDASPQQRFDFYQSIQAYWDFTEIPVVDVYVEILRKMLELFLVEFTRETYWRDEKRFALSLSHDVDYYNFWTMEHKKKIYQYNLRRLFKQPVKALYKTVFHSLDKPFYNPYLRLRKLVRAEKKFGVKSTWFLLTKKDFHDPRQNYFDDVVYREQIDDLLSQEDIQLHGSPESAFNAEILQKEMLPLQQRNFDPCGYRSHYLNFSYQATFTALEKAGVKFDSTMGYWEHIGFRAGTSFPFFPFNLADNRPFHVLEIPMCVMDTSLLSKIAMNLTPKEAIIRLMRLLTIAEQYGCLINLNWHNTTFDKVDYPGWGLVYWKIIWEAKKRGAWITNLKEVYDYWIS